MHVYRSVLTSQVVWHHLRVSISNLSRVIGQTRIVISCDLRWPSRDPQLLVAPGPSQMRWVIVILTKWVVSVCLCEIGSIFIFPHRLIMERSENGPDLRSLKSKLRDIRAVCTNSPINSQTLHFNQLNVVTAQSQIFLEVGSLDLIWPCSKNA